MYKATGFVHNYSCIMCSQQPQRALTASFLFPPMDTLFRERKCPDAQVAEVACSILYFGGIWEIILLMVV